MQIAESWHEKTTLDDLLGVPGDKINDDRIYHAFDALLPHKDDLCLHLQERYGEILGTTITENAGRPAIPVTKDEERYARSLETGGSCILRTNWHAADLKVPWNTYSELPRRKQRGI